MRFKTILIVLTASLCASAALADPPPVWCTVKGSPWFGFAHPCK